MYTVVDTQGKVVGALDLDVDPNEMYDLAIVPVLNVHLRGERDPICKGFCAGPRTEMDTSPWGPEHVAKAMAQRAQANGQGGN